MNFTMHTVDCGCVQQYKNYELSDYNILAQLTDAIIIQAKSIFVKL